MKLRICIALATAFLLAACAGKAYDSQTCEELAVKVERHDTLSQADYRQMIDQSEQILRYLVERSSALEELPADRHYAAYRELLADPDYMERFSYLFTLGSALYKADAEGLLDSSNAARYRDLDQYNSRFAEISDRM